MPIKIFLSHASDDVTLAKALIACLFDCLELRDGEVRCTSVPGHKLSVGADVATTLKNDLSDSTAVIGLLTPSALASSWVLFELGAAWGAGRHIFPIVVGAGFSVLPGPLAGKHAIHASDENGLTQLIDDLQKVVDVPPRSLPKAQAAIATLVKSFSGVDAAPKPPPEKTPVKTKVKEPTFGTIPFSELIAVLRADKVTIPADITKTGKSVETNVLNLFVSNFDIFARGLVSTWKPQTLAGFFYHRVAPKLLPFQLVKYDKLPASRYYQQISLSPTGEKFIAHWKRLQVKKAR